MIEVQLVEQSLPTPETRGSSPVIGKYYLLPTVLKDKNKKEAGKGPILLKNTISWFFSIFQCNYACINEERRSPDR